MKIELEEEFGLIDEHEDGMGQKCAKGYVTVVIGLTKKTVSISDLQAALEAMSKRKG